MVLFQFTKPNGIAKVGSVKTLNPALAKTYQRIGLGKIVEEEQPKKTTKSKKK